MTDISRLQVQLQVTKLQNKDNPLYQLLHELIGALKDTSGEVTSLSRTVNNSSSSVTNNITNNNFSLASGIGNSSAGLSATSTPSYSVVNNNPITNNNIIQLLSSIGSGLGGLHATFIPMFSPVIPSSSSGVTGTGTTGKLPKWASATSLTDSIITESTGVIGIAGSIQFSTSVLFPGAGSIFKHASNGLFIAGTAGSIFDFALTNPSGAAGIILVPTGTVNVSLGGTLTVSGYGTHEFSASGASANMISVRNTSAGVASISGFRLGNNSVSNLFELFGMGSTFTPSTIYFASGVSMDASGMGGLSIAATHASGVIRFYTGGFTERMSLSAAGELSVAASGINYNTFGGSLILQRFNVNNSWLSDNIYYDGAFRYKVNGLGVMVYFTSGHLAIYTVATGTAGNAAAVAERIRVWNTGGFSVGTTIDPGTGNFNLADQQGIGWGNRSAQIIGKAAAASYLRFDTSGDEAFGINSARDWTVGASKRIMDSVGTPTIASGFGGVGSSVAGTDYAMVITQSSTTSTAGAVSFGHTFSNTPVCVCSTSINTISVGIIVSTTQLILNYTSSANSKIYVLCRGY